MDVKTKLGLAVAAAAPALLLAAAPGGAALAAGQAPAASVQTACAVTTSGATITLVRDCDTTSSLTVPAGFSVDGAGHTITAHDPGAGAFFQGPVLTNAGDSMSLQNLTVRGTGFAGACDNANPRYGVLFNNASGSMTNVDVVDITQHAACLTGSGIGVTAASGPQTVTITNATVTDFQRSALLATGDATVNVADSTFGPPDLTVPDPGALAQDTVQYGSVAPLGGTGGTFTGNTVIGAAGSASADMLIENAANLTVSGNTFGGAGTDAGLSVSLSTGITVEYNNIARTATRPGSADSNGYGARSDDNSRSQTTLTCNAFRGWNENLDNLAQPPCITTTSLPDGIVGDKYPATLDAYTENCCPDLTWTVTAGSLPPGITLHPGGTLTGAPDKVGTYTFTVQVQDTSGGESTRVFAVTIRGDQPAPAPATPTPATPTPARTTAATPAPHDAPSADAPAPVPSLPALSAKTLPVTGPNLSSTVILGGTLIAVGLLLGLVGLPHLFQRRARGARDRS